ncbi:hypothetical protein C2U72_00820 [Prosthecomicrobium hirschii]|uniref:VIT domain-containing protein n=1 Tax=Prosthecodimorpha hirschii TaxID=665126 RepID=UPI0011285FBF|nr:VIT domain-containing protein [Prosthecomicrobium hirschii]TPQ52899.1 hypothetical protein C2U72_00820 [Prosthecomicrobium hirschii]
MTTEILASPDPLGRWKAGAHIRGSDTPVPLVSTRYDIRIRGALAEIATRRVFRNAEAGSIEATLTFPVPVQATLYGLTATIDGRRLVAQAAARSAAREVYETAIDRGRTAILHEEVLRGIHMLSVANIPPGGEVAVEDRWVVALTTLGPDADRLTPDGSVAVLRIPVTVGDLYGRSPLPDSDDLIGGGAPARATVHAAADAGILTVNGRPPGADGLELSLGRPIDLRLEGWRPTALVAPFGDGRTLRLAIAPAPVAEDRLDGDLLLDESGSMGERDGGGRSKHETAIAGLRDAVGRLRSGDRVRLWRFDERHAFVGAVTDAASLETALRGLTGPQGGTEIGSALAAVAGRPESRTVIVVTDGKSHALDVQALARTGRRFSVVLIGEDSLEANVGHLAALSGGDLFVGAAADTGRLLAAAVASARQPVTPAASDGTPLRDGLTLTRNGLAIAIDFPPGPETGAPDEAVAAFAAGLILPRLDVAAATDLALRHRLVTHLTSLVMVDEAGAVSEDLPATRKIALPAMELFTDLGIEAAAPRAYSPSMAMPATPGRGRMAPTKVMLPKHDAPASAPFGGASDGSAPAAPAPAPSLLRRLFGRRSDRGLKAVAASIPWRDITDLADLPGRLTPEQAAALDRLARHPAVAALAARLGRPVEIVAAALLAELAGPGDRNADRLARRGLAGCVEAEIAAVWQAVAP